MFLSFANNSLVKFFMVSVYFLQFENVYILTSTSTSCLYLILYLPFVNDSIMNGLL